MFLNFLERGDPDDEYITVKKARLESAVSQWSQILKRKPVSKPDAAENGGNQSRGGYYGNGNEELKRKVPFYKKISGMLLSVALMLYFINLLKVIFLINALQNGLFFIRFQTNLSL